MGLLLLPIFLGCILTILPGCSRISGQTQSQVGTVIASHDFNDGTIGQFFTYSSPGPGGELDFPDDPTGSGRGKVARMRYQHFTSPDRNIALQYIHPVTTIYFKGEFYLATS